MVAAVRQINKTGGNRKVSRNDNGELAPPQKNKQKTEDAARPPKK